MLDHVESQCQISLWGKTRKPDLFAYVSMYSNSLLHLCMRRRLFDNNKIEKMIIHSLKKKLKRHLLVFTDQKEEGREGNINSENVARF